MINFTADQIALKEYIELENANFKAKAEKEGFTICGEVITDITHWAEVGINSIEEYIHDSLATSYSEFYKEIHGIKPRWINYNDMSISDLEKEIASLVEQSKSNEEREEQYILEENQREAQRIKDNAIPKNSPFAGLNGLLKKAA